MAYSTAEARQQLLDDLAHAIDELGVALAALGDAYEALDEQTADRMEEQLFRPVQVTYGRAQRTHAGFAERHGLPTRKWTPAQPGHPSQGVKGFLETAVAAVDECDAALADLQDTMLPVEVGDPELRAGLSEVRELVGHLRHDARELVRTLGR